MKCPTCGEPVNSRHTFCTVCGADLLYAAPEHGSKAEVVSAAGKKVISVLKMPIGKQSPPVCEAAPAVQPAAVQEPVVSVPEFSVPEQDSAEAAIVPDFMRSYI